RASALQLAGIFGDRCFCPRQQRTGRHQLDGQPLISKESITMKLKKVSAAMVLITGLTATASVQAQRAWMLPSATVLSGEQAWVTVDGAVSNSLFYFEHHPLNLDALQIRSPSGSPVLAQHKAIGKYRSIFDAVLIEDGTYTFGIRNQGVFGSYVIDGERKRWRGTAADARSEEHTSELQSRENLVCR